MNEWNVLPPKPSAGWGWCICRGLKIYASMRGRSSKTNKARAEEIVATMNAMSGIPDPAAFVRAAMELAEAATQYEQASFGTVAIDIDRLTKAATAFRAADKPQP